MSSNLEIEDSNKKMEGFKKSVSIIASQSISEVAFPITVTWENIGVSTKKSNRILLENVSGIAKPGELVAIMGSSGSGKTTLLNVIMDRNMRGLRKNGTVLVNGQCLNSKITRISGFAQQQELFIPTLTVDEYLMIQAKLRIRGNRQERRQKVDEILDMLGLEKCRNLRIGTPGISAKEKGISGGEARRLTFACELLSNPSLFFADEPTSGLDSFMAATVVDIMKKLATGGRTLIVTIHQPTAELFFTCTKVIYLSLGKCAFMGTPSESVKFFSNCGYPVPNGFNPPEWIQSQLSIKPGKEEKSRERIMKIIEKYKKGASVKMLEINSVPKASLPLFTPNPGFFTKTSALYKRSTLDVIRSPVQMQMRFIQKVIMGLFIGSLYWQQPLDRRGIQNTNSAIYFLIAELTFSTMFGIMTFMEHELPLISREYHDGLFYIISYYISRCLSYLPLFTIDGVVMFLISYWMIGLNNTWQQVSRSVLVSVLIEQAATSCGLFFVCLFETTSVAIAFAVPASGLFALLSGLYGNLNNFPIYIRWMQWTSWFRYGFEALLVNQWSHVNDSKCTGTSFSQNTPSTLIISRSTSSDYLRSSCSSMWLDMFHFF